MTLEHISASASMFMLSSKVAFHHHVCSFWSEPMTLMLLCKVKESLWWFWLHECRRCRRFLNQKNFHQWSQSWRYCTFPLSEKHQVDTEYFWKWSNEQTWIESSCARAYARRGRNHEGPCAEFEGFSFQKDLRVMVVMATGFTPVLCACQDFWRGRISVSRQCPLHFLNVHWAWTEKQLS